LGPGKIYSRGGRGLIKSKKSPGKRNQVRTATKNHTHIKWNRKKPLNDKEVRKRKEGNTGGMHSVWGEEKGVIAMKEKQGSFFDEGRSVPGWNRPKGALKRMLSESGKEGVKNCSFPVR